MSEERNEWPEWRVEALREAIEAMIQARTDLTFAGIVQSIDELPAVDLGPDDVILLGPEGQIDAVWTVPPPRPEFLRRPIPPTGRALLHMKDEPVTPSIRVAEYRRSGDRTYQREMP